MKLASECQPYRLWGYQNSSLEKADKNHVLNNVYVQYYRDEKKILGEEDIDKLTWLNLQALNCEGVRKYIDDDSLSMKDALNLEWIQISALDTKAIQDSIDNGSRTVNQALLLTWDEVAQAKRHNKPVNNAGCTIL